MGLRVGGGDCLGAGMTLRDGTPWRMERVCHPSPPLWIPAFAGMTMVGGRNGPALLGRWVGLRCTGEGLPHPSPPLWIPAFAGMTMVGGRRSWEGGLASDAPRRVASPLTAPLDSGLDAGMTNGGGPALLGGWVGLRCTGRVCHAPTAPLDSGLRRNDDGGFRPSPE